MDEKRQWQQSAAGQPAWQVAPYRRLGAIILGAGLLALTIILPPPEGMPAAAWRVAGVTAMMAVWWLTEALPIPVTALVPVTAFPLFGLSSISDATAPYANPLIFLFLGGFMIALAIERWNLHRRIALVILKRFGARPSTLVAGFMIATACLSMWVSNTATALMMLPIALSVIGLLHTDGVASLPPAEDRHFAVALLLAVAYGATIGGLGTLIGTPPNALLAAYVAETYDRTVGFGEWMLIGLPMVAVLLPLAWLVLTKLTFPVGRTAIAGADKVIAAELAGLGRMGPAERRVAGVFGSVAILWVARPALDKLFPEIALSDPVIALLGAIALFVIPADLRRGKYLLNWDWAKRLPWGVLILFGGGLSLASAIGSSGLADWISHVMRSGTAWPHFILVLLVAGVVIFLTEITSNTATAAVFLPLAASFAVLISVNPFTLIVPVALAASCAFMMPVATPPNAIIFASGDVTVSHMARAGILLNLAALLLILLVTYSVVPRILGTV